MPVGRKPTPLALKVLRGNPGRRPLNEEEPQPDPRLPDCPDHLGDEAKREWDVMGQQLLTLGLVTEIDKAALAAYCAAWGRWVQAERQLRRYGPVTKAPSGFLVQNPYLAIANKALEQMMRALVEFGMTPSSRSRISAARPTKAGDDKKARFFRGRP